MDMILKLSENVQQATESLNLELVWGCNIKFILNIQTWQQWTYMTKKIYYFSKDGTCKVKSRISH